MSSALFFYLLGLVIHLEMTELVGQFCQSYSGTSDPCEYLLTHQLWNHCGDSCPIGAHNYTYCVNYLDHDRLCILVSQKQQFSASCPPGFFKYYNLSHVDPSIDYWSSTRRTGDVFMHTAPDMLYGKEFVAPDQPEDCFVMKNGTQLPAFCNASHHQLCIQGMTEQERMDININSTRNPLQMRLNFDRKRSKLLLNVYNPSKVLSKLDDDDDAIYCFTNADNVELKTPLRLKKIMSKSTLDVHQIDLKYDHPAEYWCEAFDRDQEVIKSNVLVGYKKKKGNEYSLRLILKKICSLHFEENAKSETRESCHIVDGQLVMNFLKNIDFKGSLYSYDCVIRVMKIFGKTLKNSEDVDVILHLTTTHKANVVGEYHKLFRLLQVIQDQSNSILIKWFRSVDYCLPEVTTQFEISKPALRWKLTPLSKSGSPDKLCLDTKMLLLKRKCQGGFIEGAVWEQFDETCQQNVTITAQTETLYNLSQFISYNSLNSTIIEEIHDITSNSKELIPLDIYLIATILNHSPESGNDGGEDTAKDVGKSEDIKEIHDGDTAKNEKVLERLAQTVTNLMSINRTVLKAAQIELNATDALLDFLEKFFDEDSFFVKREIWRVLNKDGVILIVKDKFILHICKPFVSNIHGVVVYKHNNSIDDSEVSNQEKFSRDLVKSIPIGHMFQHLENLDQVDLATYVPIEILESILEENNIWKENITIITTVFYNDFFFNSEIVKEQSVRSKVISVKIPDYGLYLTKPLPLLFRQSLQEEYVETGDTEKTIWDDFQENNTNSVVAISTLCAYWQYGEYATNQKGYWSQLGSSSRNQNFTVLETSTLSTCYFDHLTHFALLIMRQKLVFPEIEKGVDFDVDFVDVGLIVIDDSAKLHNNLLTIITIAGCILSLIGILGIFITAVVFPRWRQKMGSKILLHLSAAIMLEIIVIHIAGLKELTSRTQLCTIVGISLHYIVLVKCCWMFVSAILQYLRFVMVFKVLPTRLILKAIIFAWGFPMIPVGIVGGLQGDSNVAGRTFCYPVDLGLYIGLFLPVAVIVGCNLIVFVSIMKNMFCSKMGVKPRSSYKNNTEQNRLHIYLGILLFFVLGMPWVFGILAEILVWPLQMVCIYLFCLTATLQGLVIFVFYVGLDGDTRQLWINLFVKKQ